MLKEAIKWKKFSEELPTCNSDVFMTNFIDIFYIPNCDGEETFHAPVPTHWISVLDMKNIIESAKINLKWHCSHTTEAPSEKYL